MEVGPGAAGSGYSFAENAATKQSLQVVLLLHFQAKGTHPGIAASVSRQNHHCFCYIHISRNVEKAVGKQVTKHAHTLSATFSKRESDELLTKNNEISVRGCAYLDDILQPQSVEEHRLGECPKNLPPRFGIVTTKMLERWKLAGVYQHHCQNNDEQDLHKIIKCDALHIWGTLE
ncbi:hypothetical protein IV203_010504 [Nitzschia inconspicua]|uniref:Uncharacterized protein n=1 Tax=Nitzschia inconspicua TaxID=303405 RepID=A0A9K3KXE7_9STRA|nr:hypothetical protein IV203_010504 [Nitzschia inconspicua]